MARGGAAISFDDPRSSGAVESWTLTLVAVEQWLATAKQGDTLTYAHGPSLVRGAAAEHLRRQQDNGEVILCQKREGEGFDYRAIRNRVRVIAERTERPRAPVPPLIRDLIVVIEAAARLGKRCQSNYELGKALGIPEEGAKWQLRKAASLGLIRTRIVPAPGEPKFRIVTILANGLETAGPEAVR